MAAQPVPDAGTVPDVDLPHPQSPAARRTRLAVSGVLDVVASTGGRLRDFVLTELFLKRSPY
jgi:hypothetical protein